MASSSSIALTGKNPGFLQATFGPTGFASSGQPTPASYVPLNALIGNFPVTEKTEIYSLRIDHKISNTQQLLLRGTASPSYISGIQENASNQNFGQNSGSRTAEQRLHDWAILGQHTYLIGSNKVNEARFQFARHPVEFENQNTVQGNNVAVNIPGFAYFGKTPFSDVNRVEDQSQFQDNFTYTVKGHTLKTGVDVRYVLINFVKVQTYQGGDYSFGNVAIAAGTPSLSAVQAYGLGIPQSFVQSIGTQNGKDNIDVLGAYAQDSYKLHRLTLNYGIRYDAERFQLKPEGNALTQHAFDAYNAVEGINTRLGNIAPRVGFAFDVYGTGKSIVRGNYGLFYNRAPGNLGPQSQTIDSYDNPLIILSRRFGLHGGIDQQPHQPERDQRLPGLGFERQLRPDGRLELSALAAALRRRQQQLAFYRRPLPRRRFPADDPSLRDAGVEVLAHAVRAADLVRHRAGSRP